MAQRCPEIDALERHVRVGCPDIEGHLSGCASCRSIAADIRANLEAEEGVRRALRDASVAPARIDGFRIIGTLGRGGMGVVYEAEQERPRRRVALKMISALRADPEARRRFERESLALGRLRHPGIAQVHHAGVVETPEGTQPYFVMELVRGTPLLEHIRLHGVGARETLALVAEVCDAVHHAHERGVVHRDLKPANILVEEAEPSSAGVRGAGGSSDSAWAQASVRGARPKVVDFGVARLLDAEGGGQTQRTLAGQLLGTAPYMSPEQVGAGAGAADARSDVYALGVILFEALTGRLPYALPAGDLAGAVRVISEEEPTRLGVVDRRFRGDVETIVARALEKDPDRRYQSAAELAADIRRSLANEPIVARPPSAVYQLRKFARRNRALVAGLCAVFLALLAGAAVSAHQAVRATRGEAAARREMEKARAAIEFLREALASADPAHGPSKPDLTVRELLERAGARIDSGDLEGQPDIEMTALMTIGNAHRGLGDLRSADRRLRRAVEIGRRLHPEGHEDLAWSLNKLARTMMEAGDAPEGEAMFREALAMRRRLHGSESEEVATVLNNLAHCMFVQGRFEEAASTHREALAMRRRLLGDEHVDVASSLNNLAAAVFRLGDRAEAEALYRESLAVERRAREGDHPNLAATLDNLATAVRLGGGLDESEALLRESLEMRNRLYPDGHPSVAIGLNNLALLLRDQGRMEDAEASLREAVALNERLLGDDHPEVATALTNLGALLSRRGEFSQSAAALERALEIRVTRLGEGHPDTIIGAFLLARTRAGAGDLEGAVEGYGAVVEQARRTMAPGDPRRAVFLTHYGEALLAADRRREAEAALLEAYDAHLLGDGDSPEAARVAESLVRLYEEQGREADAAAWRERH